MIQTCYCQCVCETCFHCVNLDSFQILLYRNARGFWGAEVVGLPHRLNYLHVGAAAEIDLELKNVFEKDWGARRAKTAEPVVERNKSGSKGMGEGQCGEKV